MIILNYDVHLRNDVMIILLNHRSFHSMMDMNYRRSLVIISILMTSDCRYGYTT